MGSEGRKKGRSTQNSKDKCQVQHILLLAPELQSCFTGEYWSFWDCHRSDIQACTLYLHQPKGGSFQWDLCPYKAKDFMILGERCQGRSMIHTLCVFYGIKDTI